MTREDALQAIETGIELVREQKAQGIKLLATGEMGIGNTTTSAAVSSVLLGRAPEEMTGRGAGLSNDGLRRKIEAIYKGIAINHPEKADVIGVLSALGGLDIAGLCGVFLGGALENIPVIIDGFISSVAALCAARLCPTATKAMFASHVSARGAYRFGSARQKAAHHGEYAPRRGHRRGRKPAAVGHGTRGLRQLLFVHGGRHRAVHPAMLTLVIGGAASGKSAYAESLTLKLPLPRYYVATMQVWDEECAKRVEKHRAM